MWKTLMNIESPGETSSLEEESDEEIEIEQIQNLKANIKNKCNWVKLGDG